MVVRLPPSASNGTSEVWNIRLSRNGACFLANATMFEKHPLKARFGGLAVAVPGEVRGLAELYAMGQIAMEEAGTTQRRPCRGLGCGQGTRPQDKCKFMFPEERYSI